MHFALYTVMSKLDFCGKCPHFPGLGHIFEDLWYTDVHVHVYVDKRFELGVSTSPAGDSVARSTNWK